MPMFFQEELSDVGCSLAWYSLRGSNLFSLHFVLGNGQNDDFEVYQKLKIVPRNWKYFTKLKENKPLRNM